MEEGWFNGNIVTLTAEKYLSPIKKYGADVLILGCTHYPMIKKVIADVVKIPLIDSATETAQEVKRILEEKKMKRLNSVKSKREFFVQKKNSFILGKNF